MLPRGRGWVRKDLESVTVITESHSGGKKRW